MLAGVVGKNHAHAKAKQPGHVIHPYRPGFIEHDHRLRGQIASVLTQEGFEVGVFPMNPP